MWGNGSYGYLCFTNGVFGLVEIQCRDNYFLPPFKKRAPKIPVFQGMEVGFSCQQISIWKWWVKGISFPCSGGGYP